MSSASERQFELMLPFQIRAEMARNPVAYVPLGTLEWHCEHLPVGLDALTAHGLCLRAAALTSGVVLPPLHVGTGGDHGPYPFTIMMPGAEQIAAILGQTLTRLRNFGFQKVVLLSGHFPALQLEMIDQLALAFSAPGFKVIATAVNRIEGLRLAPDHAGRFETTLLYAMHPTLVQLDRLPSLASRPLTPGDVWDQGRHDPQHPIWGVVGPDPRNFMPDEAEELLQTAVKWLAAQVLSD